MKPPTCRLCSHAHWSTELCVLPEPVATTQPPTVDATPPVDTTRARLVDPTVEQLKTYISELEAENEKLRAQVDAQRIKKREQMKRYRERKNSL